MSTMICKKDPTLFYSFYLIENMFWIFVRIDIRTFLSLQQLSSAMLHNMTSVIKRKLIGQYNTIDQ